jgi:hypothetical protein
MHKFESITLQRRVRNEPCRYQAAPWPDGDLDPCAVPFAASEETFLSPPSLSLNLKALVRHETSHRLRNLLG